jgi:hypothetical protein
MKKFVPEILAGLGIIAAVALLLHQYIRYSCPTFFHVSELLSHEVAASFCVVAAVFLVIGKYLGRYFR